MIEVDAFADPVIVGVDPGGHTGIATYRSGGLVNTPGTEFASTEIDGRFAFYDLFDTVVGLGVPLVVVCESYIITGATAAKSQQLDALYIIGALERQCRKLGHPFHLQPPSAKAFAPDDKLKALGWYTPGKGHSNDAARHLLKFAVSNKVDGADDLLARLVSGLGLVLT